MSGGSKESTAYSTVLAEKEAGEKRVRAATEALTAVTGEYKEVRDPASGKSYWYSRKTKSTTWKSPIAAAKSEMEDAVAKLTGINARLVTALQFKQEAEDKSMNTTTLAGDGNSAGRDGVGQSARLSSPHAIISAEDGQSLLITEIGSNNVRRYHLGDCHVSTVLGNGTGFANGSAKQVMFNRLNAICADPSRVGCYYFGDLSSVRHWDSWSGMTILIAGDAKEGYMDGVGVRAGLWNLADILITPNGKTLYVTEWSNNRIRQIDLTTLIVTTIVGDGLASNRDGTGLKASIYQPHRMVWDYTSADPHSAFLVSCYRSIRRVSLTSQYRVSTLSFKCEETIDPCGMDWTPSKQYLVLTCSNTHSVYAYSPSTGETLRVAGSGSYSGFADGHPLSTARFNAPRGVKIVPSQQCAIVADRGNQRLCKVPLKPEWFIPPFAAGSGGASASVVASSAPSQNAIAPQNMQNPHTECELREAKLTASLKASQDREANLTAELQAVRAGLADETNKRMAMAQQLKAAESLAASAKSRIAELERTVHRLGEGRKFIAEVNDKPAAEWSSGAVVYWIENVFAPEHKSAKLDEFVAELRARSNNTAAAGPPLTGSELLSLATVKQFRAVKLSDLETIEMFQDALEQLKKRGAASNAGRNAAPPGGPNGSDSSASGDVLPP